jgi:hypothetical protein
LADRVSSATALSQAARETRSLLGEYSENGPEL